MAFISIKGQTSYGRPFLNPQVRRVLGLNLEDPSRFTLLPYPRAHKLAKLFDKRLRYTRLSEVPSFIQTSQSDLPQNRHSSCRSANSQERRQKISLCIEGIKKSMDNPAKERPEFNIKVQPKPKRKQPIVPFKILLSKQTKRKNTVKVEVISIKEAVRDKEWLQKAKDQILRDWNLLINTSNGLQITPANSYKYYVGAGNNSPLVKQLMSARTWWTRVGEDEKMTANFVWTQCKDRTFLQSLEELPNVPGVDGLEAPRSIRCQTKYIVHIPESIHAVQKKVDLSPLNLDLVTLSDSYIGAEHRDYNACKLQVHNKLEANFHITNKKGLFYNMKAYYDALGRKPFQVIPLTYHVASLEDPGYLEFEKSFTNGIYWIVKPGEFSNRGDGIHVCASLEQIRQVIVQGLHTFIIQKYIEKPFLIHRRKFDIRCYALITCYNGIMQGYFYTEGYIRTASKSFTLNNLANKLIHLTNDAVQKKADDYGKFENGNKLSYGDFQRYIDNHTDLKVQFVEEVLPRMKEIVRDTMKAAFLKVDTLKCAHTFEIFGYDFLLDANLKPWLLEVNTNPCLELSSPHLARIIPAMLENSFKIALDPIFPCFGKRGFGDVLAENKYELIFHSLVEGVDIVDELNKKGTLELVLNSYPSELSDAEEDHPEFNLDEAAA